MSSDASEENWIEQNNNEEVYWWKTHTDIKSKRKFCWAFENDIYSFILFFLICLPLSFDFIYQSHFSCLSSSFSECGSKIVAKTGLMVPTRAWTYKEANTFSIFQFCLVRSLFMRVWNYDSFFRRHSSLIPRLTLTELNEVAAQGQCSLTSAVGDFYMVATRNAKCQGNSSSIRSSPSFCNKP